MSQYELKESFQYATAGSQENAQFIELISPHRKSLQYYHPVKSAFMQAVHFLNDDASDDEKSEPPKETPDSVDSEGVMSLMYACPDVDMNKVFLNVYELLKSGGGRLDGQEKITEPILDKLSSVDLEGVVGAYIATFIVPSPTGGR